MHRNYDLMRLLLKDASMEWGELGIEGFARYVAEGGVDAGGILAEMDRLRGDGLLLGSCALDARGRLVGATLDGLTDEGRAFWRLIENDDVWAIVRDVLAAADIDISYPLLKEVCEEIVKRYVTSFIPDIPRGA